MAVLPHARLCALSACLSYFAATHFTRCKTGGCDARSDARAARQTVGQYVPPDGDSGSPAWQTFSFVAAGPGVAVLTFDYWSESRPPWRAPLFATRKELIATLAASRWAAVWALMMGPFCCLQGRCGECGDCHVDGHCPSYVTPALSLGGSAAAFPRPCSPCTYL